MGTKSRRPFIKLPLDLLDSEVWFNLSRPAKTVYLSIRRMRYKTDTRGKAACVNWDSIPFGHSDVLDNMHKKTFREAIEELRRVKLIKLEVPGSYPNKKAVYSLLLFRG